MQNMNGSAAMLRASHRSREKIRGKHDPQLPSQQNIHCLYHANERIPAAVQSRRNVLAPAFAA
jgi:hypothetical protein